MSSGFVSGGTIDESSQRDDEWLRAERELEEERKRKADLAKQNEGKSLYEILQQNKIAKQEAFEESIRLKHQFRALDEDDAEFLDSLLESTRAKEAAIKKETAEQLAEFHRQREQAERAMLESASKEKAPTGAPEKEQWVTSGRKRKRAKKELLPQTKVQKSSTVASPPAQEASAAERSASEHPKQASTSKPQKTQQRSPGKIPSTAGSEDQGEQTCEAEPTSKAASTGSKGLVAYSSDDE